MDMVIIDEMNKKILHLLQMDGRMTYKEVAAHLKRSESTVRDRIQNMEREEIIKGYTAIVDKSKLGYKCDAMVLCNIDPRQMHSVIPDLIKLDAVSQVFHITGERRVMFRITAQEPRELEQLINRKLIPLGIINLDLHIIMEAKEKFPPTAVPLVLSKPVPELTR